MTPHQGSGAGIAIEDAYVLGALLAHAHTTLPTVPTALKIYEAVGLRHANEVQQRSRLQGLLYEHADSRFSSPASRVITNTEECKVDMEGLRALGDAIMENWKWTWETDPHDNLTKAVSMLINREVEA